MNTFALRFFVALLTFTIGTAVASLFAPRQYRMPERPRRHCSASVVELSPPTLSVPPPSVDIRLFVPPGWYRVDAQGLFAFHLPKSMKLSSSEMSEEARWGSYFSDGRIRLHAAYTTWSEGWAPEYLAKQLEYEKEITEISGRKAVVRSWRLAEPREYKYEAEVRIYDADGKKLVEMDATCKDRQDVEVAERIFRTVDFP